MSALALALVACCWAFVLIADVPEPRRRAAVFMLALATPSIALFGVVLR